MLRLRCKNLTTGLNLAKIVAILNFSEFLKFSFVNIKKASPKREKNLYIFKVRNKGEIKFTAKNPEKIIKAKLILVFKSGFIDQIFYF